MKYGVSNPIRDLDVHTVSDENGNPFIFVDVKWHDATTYERFRFDIEDGVRVDGHNLTDEQRYQFLETRSQRDAAEADRLAKKLQAEGRGLPVVQTSAFAIRDEEIEVRTVGRPNPGGQQVGVYAGVVAVHRLTGISFLVDDERSQVRNREKAVRRLKETLQPIGETVSEVERLRAKCAAMEKVVEWALAWRDDSRTGSAWGRPSVADGLLCEVIDAYRKQVPR